MTNPKVQIVIEAKTASAVKAMQDLGGASAKAKDGTVAVSAAQKQLAREMEINKARIDANRERLEKFGEAHDRAAMKMSRVAGATSSFGSSLTALRTPALAGAAALTGLALAANEISRESLQVQAVFRNLPFALEPARRATHGLVDDMTLATKANQASALGVATNAQEFANLSRAAQALGQKLGTSTEDAFESLVAAVGRGSSAMLDNLGIVVKQEQAHEIYARSLGKTVSQLTEAEKAEAFRKVALQKIFEAADQVTVVTDGAAAATQRYRVELDNLKTAALGGEERTVSLRQGLLQLTQAERDGAVNGRQYGAVIQDLKDRLSDLGVAYSDMPRTVEGWIAATEDASAALRRQAMDAELAARSVKSVRAAMAARGRAETAAAKLTATAERASELRQLEDQLAFDQARGVDTSVALTRQAELRIGFAEQEGKAAEAAQIRREEELRLLREQGEQLKRNASHRGEIENTTDPFGKNYKFVRRYDRESVIREAQQQALDEKDRRNAAVNDAARAAANSAPSGRTAEEIEAQHIKELEEVRSAAEESQQKRHAAEMKRIAQEQQRREALGSAIGTSLASIAAASLASGDLSAKGFRRVLGEWGKSESIRLAAIAISESVQALVSLATFNPAGAALHGAAAGSAAAAAAAIAAMTGAVGGFGSSSRSPGKGFGGNAFGDPAGAGSGADSARLSNSQEDAVPLSSQEMAQHSSSRGRRGGTTIVVNAQVLGAIDKTTGMKLAQGIRAAERSLGRTGS